MIAVALLPFAILAEPPTFRVEPFPGVYVERYEPTTPALFDPVAARTWRFEEEWRVGVRFTVRF
jgi:hypothetical protein